MSDNERMPKIDLSKLRKTELDFIKFVEKQNLQRVEKLQRLRRRNLWTAGVIGAAAFGVYCFSMLSVKQEKFLDDFDEPAKTQVESQ